jgi:tripartite-type tricarboxylate transporter receptor subunit TctC
VLADPQMETRLVELGGTPAVMSPAQFQAFVADETAKWGKVVKFSGAKPQ